MDAQENYIRKIDDEIYKLHRNLKSVGEEIQDLQDTQQIITTKLSALMADSAKLQNLFKVVIEGNGEPALKTQTVLLQRDFNALKESINNLPSKLDLTLMNQQLDNLDGQILELKTQADKLKDIKDKLTFEIFKALLIAGALASTAWVGRIVYRELRKPHPKPIDAAYVIYMDKDERDFLDKEQYNRIEHFTG